MQLHTCVCAVMCFEVGALCVCFPTANVVTRVSGDSLPRPGAPAAFGFGSSGKQSPLEIMRGSVGVKRSQTRSIFYLTIQRNYASYNTVEYGHRFGFGAFMKGKLHL